MIRASQGRHLAALNAADVFGQGTSALTGSVHSPEEEPRPMFRRVRGLFVITRALLPILVVIALAIATWLMARTIVDSTTDYGRKMATELEAVQQALDEANEGLEAIGGFVAATAGAADTLVGRIADIPDALTVPLPRVDIPDFRIPIINQTIRLPEFDLGTGDLQIPIPGMGPIRDLAQELVDAGESIADPILKTAALADVPPHLETAATETVAYADDVRRTMWRWMIVVLLILLLAGIIWLVAALRPMTSELGRGWAMLAGRPAPDRAIRTLEQRVKALERQLASK